jgi:iron(III) transport system permease protein
LVVVGVATIILLSQQADARVLFLLRNSLILGLGSNLIALPLGVTLALLLLRTDVPGRRIGLAVLTGLLFLPLYLQAAAWDAAFGLQGWWFLNATSGPAAWHANLVRVFQVDPRAIWIHGVAAVPWVVLIVGMGMRLVERDLEDAAALDMSAWGVFFRVTLVRSLPAIAVAALWLLVMAAGEIAVTDIYQVRTYAEEVYTTVPLLEFATSVAEAPADAGVSLPPGAGFMAMLCMATLLTTAYLVPSESAAGIRPGKTYPLGRYRWVGLLVLLIAASLVVALPLSNLLYKAGLEVRNTEAGWLRSWSGAKCLWTICASPLRFREEIAWSIIIGGIAASVTLALAAPLAWSARRNTWAALPALGVVVIGLAVPGPMIGLRIISLLNRPDSPLLIWLYDRTLVPPVMAQVIRALPMVVLVCWYAFRSLSARPLEMAALDGAGPVRRFLQIGIPQRRAALLAAWCVALAVCLGDLSASNLTVPPGITTIPVRVFGLLHAGVDDQVAGVCLTMTLVTILVAGITLWLVQRAERDVQKMDLSRL